MDLFILKLVIHKTVIIVTSNVCACVCIYTHTHTLCGCECGVGRTP